MNWSWVGLELKKLIHMKLNSTLDRTNSCLVELGLIWLDSFNAIYALVCLCNYRNRTSYGLVSLVGSIKGSGSEAQPL